MRAAAAAVGVAQRTLEAWMYAHDAFKAALRKARAQALQQAAARLAGASGKAASTLEALLDVNDPQTRCRAALGILSMAVKTAETDDVLARLDALEQRARSAAAPTFPRSA